MMQDTTTSDDLRESGNIQLLGAHIHASIQRRNVRDSFKREEVNEHVSVLSDSDFLARGRTVFTPEGLRQAKENYEMDYSRFDE